MNEFIAHWAQCDAALAPGALLVGLPDDTTCSQVQFVAWRDSLQAQKNAVQGCLTGQLIVRGSIYLKKVALHAQFSQFVSLLDGYFQNTDFYAARPYAPGVNDGPETFTRPMVDMMLLWEKINAGVAPAGITLPLILGDGTEQGAFASAVSTLQSSYANERDEAQDLILARAKRDRMEGRAYEIMKSYRGAVPGRLTAHPALVDTMPRLTPLPGHTPAAVNASAVFEAPNACRVVYDASSDGMLKRYELRGTVGDRYIDGDAVVIASHGPNDPRVFTHAFGLNQPGAEVALKVFVVLTTGNEAGSAAMLVERPANIEALAA
jgi:hypothetical protein